MKSWLQKLVLLTALLLATRGARSADYNHKPPPEVVKAMRPGAISVAYTTLNVGPHGSPAAVNVSVVPKAGMMSFNSEGTPTRIKTPKTRAELFRNYTDYSLAFAIEPSTFIMDVFEAPVGRPQARLHLVNSVRFTDNRNVNSIVLSYLKPKQKQGPMLAIGYSVFRSFSLRMFTFPGGLGGKVAMNEFLKGYGGAERGTRFDSGGVDARGNTILQESGYSPGRTDWIVNHVWNGRRFVAQPKIVTPNP